MNAYEKARDLIQRIESHRVKIDSHQKMIGQLQGELQSALEQADIKTSEGAGAPPEKAKPAVPAKKIVPGKTPFPVAVTAAAKRSHKKKVIVPPKPAVTPAKRVVATSKAAAAKSAQRNTTKSGPSKNGIKRKTLADKPTLGDLVRTVIIKAGRPLDRAEIQSGLQELNYTNSTPNPYKTLGVRLHRLDSRGVVSVGRSQFDVTPEWKKKHARQAAAAGKKLKRPINVANRKEAAETPAAAETAAPAQ
jgi:hypothetical protein